jgi:hypothetical protein
LTEEGFALIHLSPRFVPLFSLSEFLFTESTDCGGGDYGDGWEGQVICIYPYLPKIACVKISAGCGMLEFLDTHIEASSDGVVRYVLTNLPSYLANVLRDI